MRDKMVVKYAENITEKDLVESLLDWQKRGLQETASGYGKKLTTRYKVKYQSRMRRVYAICYSNLASYYIIVKKEKLYLNM